MIPFLALGMLYVMLSKAKNNPNSVENRLARIEAMLTEMQRKGKK